MTRTYHQGIACRWLLRAAAMLACCAGPVWATSEFVSHSPAAQVYGEPAGVHMRHPGAPAAGQPVEIFVRIGYQFYQNAAAVYYTTNGSEPQGAFGTATNGTAVPMSFVRIEPGSPNIDWWKATLPAQPHGTVVRYKISAWHTGGGIEVFANNTGCSDNVCDLTPQSQKVFSYTVGSGQLPMPWPGRGYGNASPQEGFPNTHFWKEEAVVGNHFINVMIDQNGTVYDVYYPTAGNVSGVSTKNEGYVDGVDTWPAGLTPGFRGQMHVEQVQAGLRIDGLTYWISNEAGDAYSNHQQYYLQQTNVVFTTSTLTRNGYNIRVDQYDFCPRGVLFPTTPGNQPIRGIHVKRFLLTNQGTATRTIDFYYMADFAVNGRDWFDGWFEDKPRGAMIAYDNTQRWTSSSGEYNPTFAGDYNKNVSIYLAASLKLCNAVGSAAGVPATDSWRDTSDDNNEGWVGIRLTLNPGETRELNAAIVGGFDPFPGATGTYGYWIAPALDWFLGSSMAAVQMETENSWRAWLADGVTVDFPDDSFDALYERSLLATALHVDGVYGGVIAGMHNGAYPFVWPRDALYAAVTLARTGHTAESEKVFYFLRDVCERGEEEPGRRGWWYQKYTTDGRKVWTAPQVDETANVTWAGYYHYLTTGNLNFLNDFYWMFYEAARAMSEDSNLSTQIYYADPYDLMYSNNVWEDSYDAFLYSNATVVRGLRDAATIATLTGHPADAALFTARANAILNGMNARLDWNGENTDVSQLGLVWPFETHAANDPRIQLVVNRMKGTATDRWGNHHPIVNFAGEFAGLINRYWGDNYWGGGPWFLSTLWWGQYYARLADFNPGHADIDVLRDKIDLTEDWNGPVGLGAEQMAPSWSLLYPGQSDFRLQAAWPNAWESMSLFVDSLMLFLDHRPDAPANRLICAPKLPGGWGTMTYRNLHVGSRRVDVTCEESPGTESCRHIFRNVAGGPVNIDTIIRIPPGKSPTTVTRNGSPVSYSLAGASRVRILDSLETAAGSTTEFKVFYGTLLPRPVLTAAVSRKIHGGAGTFDVNALASGAVEGRSGGVTRLVATFDVNIQRLGGAGDVTVSSGTVSALTVAGPQLTVDLTGTTDGAPLIMAFPGIAHAADITRTSASTLCLLLVRGDVNADRTVNIFDLVSIRNQLSQPVGVGNFRTDVTADGSVNIFDLVTVRNNLGATSTTCP